MLKEFTYVKASGQVSERKVWAIRLPSDMLFGLDLSEFTPEDMDAYVAELTLLEEDYKQAIYDMGLASQYRNFKEDGIVYDEEDSGT